MYNNV